MNEYRISGAQLSIGRGDCDVRLDDPDVSWIQLRVVREGRSFFVVDESSSRYTRPGAPDARSPCLAPGTSTADARLHGTLVVVIEQVFDDLLPEEVSLDQIPARVTVDGTTLSLSASVVRCVHGSVDGLLFTVADITELIEAEREVEQMHGTLKVLRYHDRFEAFVHEFAEQLRELEAEPHSPAWQERARRHLHTAKGVFGQFGISRLQRRIHTIEDAVEITVDHLREARVALQGVLDENADLWNVDLQPGDPTYAVTATTLDDLDARVQRAQTVEEARSLVHDALVQVRRKPAAEVLGPIRDAVEQLAARKGKRVRTTVRGAEHRLPDRLGPVFDQLGHLVRNAVDHGIEAPEMRGDKDPTATVSVNVHQEPEGWRITVADDGQGIDSARIAERAVELGAVPEERVQRMTDAERLELLFVDGLSTAEGVSDTSGRGVGMAAVRATVEDLGGRIQISSTRGQGTQFDLLLPDPESELTPV